MLDLPDHIIEHISDFLKLKGKLNFGLSCKKFNDIINSRSKNWRDIIFVVKNNKQSTEVTRPYPNIRWECSANAPSQLNLDVWMCLAENMVKLEISYKDYELNMLIDALPFFENLVELEVNTSCGSHRKFPFAPDANSVKVQMRKLKALSMGITLFSLLNQQYVNFSTKHLKVLKLRGFYDELPLLNPEMIKDFVLRQKSLEELEMKGMIRRLFNQSFDLNVQLKSLNLTISDNMSMSQQDFLCELLKSQKSLESVSFSFGGLSAACVRRYQIKLLDLPVVLQKFWIEKENSEKTCHCNIPVREFLDYPHIPNLITKELRMKITVTSDFEEVFNTVCLKFPNLTDLSLELNKDRSNEVVMTVNLSSLGRLTHLENLELNSNVTNTIGLGEVLMPNLKKFEYYSFTTEQDTESFDDLKEFLGNNETLEHFDFFVKNQADSVAQINVIKIAMRSLKNLMVLKTYMQKIATIRDCQKFIARNAEPGFTMKILDKETGSVTMKLTKGENRSVNVAFCEDTE